MIHSDQYGAVAHRSFMIELEDKWLTTCRHFPGLFEGYRHFPSRPVPALALRIYHESRIKDSVAQVIVEGLMLEMLGHASRSLIKTPVRPPGWLTQARDLLHGRFNDSLNLIEIANTVGSSPDTPGAHFQETLSHNRRRVSAPLSSRLGFVPVIGD